MISISGKQWEEKRVSKNLVEKLKQDHKFSEIISKLMSKSRSHISNTLRLLTLPADVISMLQEGSLTAGQARPLIGLSNSSSIAEEIVSNNYSARKVEYLVKSKKVKKPREINLYSPEYLQKKHGISLDNVETNKKQITDKKVSFGFYNSLLLFIVVIIYLVK